VEGVEVEGVARKELVRQCSMKHKKLFEENGARKFEAEFTLGPILGEVTQSGDLWFQGMHSVVFECTERNSAARQLAVKKIRESDEEKIRAHEKEFEILRGLNHPNIVKAERLFVDRMRGEIFIVMERVAGKEVLE